MSLRHRLISAGGRADAPPSFFVSVAVAVAFSLPTLLTYSLPGWATALEFRRDALAAGEWWRLVTCHWTHWSFDHLIWDLGVFALLVALCWRVGRVRTLVAIGASTVAVPVAVWVFLPSMSHYRGLSGIDSALFVLFALLEIRMARADGRRAAVWLFAALLATLPIKVGFELLTGSTLFVDNATSSFVPVPLAHLVGFGCGALGAVNWPWSGVRLRITGRGPKSAKTRALRSFTEEA